MALTIMMIVLIAVMGAGLLTFAMRDLNAVVEVNQGQKASEAADLRIQAAKRQLLANSFPNLYNDPAYPLPLRSIPTHPNVEWAVTSPSAVCSGLPSGLAKCMTSTSNGDTRVRIRASAEWPRFGSWKQGRSQLCSSKPALGANGVCRSKRTTLGSIRRLSTEKARRKIQAIYITGSPGSPATSALRATSTSMAERR